MIKDPQSKVMKKFLEKFRLKLDAEMVNALLFPYTGSFLPKRTRGRPSKQRLEDEKNELEQRKLYKETFDKQVDELIRNRK